jgi:hypothetical protein
LFHGFKALKTLQLSEFSQGFGFMKAFQIGELPLVTGMVAGEGSRGLRIGKILPNILKFIPKLQNLLHFLRGLPELVTLYSKDSIHSLLVDTSETSTEKSDNRFPPYISPSAI